MNEKVAICYWGMTRSLKKNKHTHKKFIYDILKSNNYDYDIFIHTWKTKTQKQMVWLKESDVLIDEEEYKCINPNYYKIDSQDDFIDNIEFEKYFYEDQYKKFGVPRTNGKGDWIPQLLKNHLCALESLKRVYKMVKETEKRYKYIIFVRPDSTFHKKLNFSLIDNLEENEVLIQDRDHYNGYNDRFAVGHPDIMGKYANRIDEAIEFRKNVHRIDSESFCKYIINKYGKVKKGQIHFSLVRPQST
tara:strand:- start:4386 stop:5123 length:738 start_codon:yes stop_codon:yes gene_type:complete